MQTKTKLFGILIYCAVLQACGGGSSSSGGGSETPNKENLAIEPDPTEETITNIELAEMRIASNNCVMDHNAEAEYIFELGYGDDENYEQLKNNGGHYKSLTWNCADYDFYENKRIEALLKLSNSSGCYKLSQVIATQGKCGVLAEEPESLKYDNKILNFELYSLDFNKYGGTNYVLDYDIGVKNSSDFTAWGLYFKLLLEGVTVKKLMPLDHNYMNHTLSNGTNGEGSKEEDYISFRLSCTALHDDLCPLLSGHEYQITFELYNTFGILLDSQTKAVTYQSWSFK